MLLDDVKATLLIRSNNFDGQLELLIEAGKKDLEVAGIDPIAISEDDPLIRRAIITYCTLYFGMPYEESSSRKSLYTNLKASYDEQKAQLSMHTGHTIW